MNIDDRMFDIAMVLVVIAWLPLIIFPAKRAFNWWLAGVIIPFVICMMFTVLLLTSWDQPPNQSFLATVISRFMSFPGVVKMLTNQGLLDATWLDNLTTGMMTGAWITRRAQRTRLPRFALVICQLLVATASPIGVALYFIIEGTRGRLSEPTGQPER